VILLLGSFTLDGDYDEQTHFYCHFYCETNLP